MGHPAALGILLKCIGMQEKQEKGIENHRMRKMTDVEAGVINEAAVLLACNGASADLMKTLGFSKSMILRTYSRLDTLLEQGLPNPALALLFPEVTEQNEIVRMMDELLHRCQDYVRVFLFDGEACNQLLKSIIFGQLDAHHRRSVMDLKFFSKLTFGECPGLSVLPRCPIKSCFFDQDQIFAMQGPSHALKNTAAQICAEGKVVFFGKFMTDCSGMLANDLPLPAFNRKDGMSDRLTALLSSPMYLIPNEVLGVAEIDDVCIPWMKACAKKALAAALLLVSKCSGIETQDLEALYRKESVGDFFTYEEETGEVDLLEHAYMEVECEEAMKAEHNEFQHVLTQIESVAQEEYADDENSDGDGEAPQPVDPDRLLPDGEGLINLTTCADSPSDDAPLPYPKTLEEEGFYE
ncbi:unnamed protein product, partial [Durusdinium trenchii]